MHVVTEEVGQEDEEEKLGGFGDHHYPNSGGAYRNETQQSIEVTALTSEGAEIERISTEKS